jgi:hypothetical protein
MRARIKKEININGSFFSVYSIRDNNGLEVCEKSFCYYNDVKINSPFSEKSQFAKALVAARLIENPQDDEIVYETGVKEL